MTNKNSIEKPSRELVAAFFAWYESGTHKMNEDYYIGTITYDALANLSREHFIDFFSQFAREGGMVQSGGHRTASKFQKTIEEKHDQFRAFILEPYSNEFDVFQWLDRINEFSSFGQGLATIYLNRVDKKRCDYSGRVKSQS